MIFFCLHLELDVTMNFYTETQFLRFQTIMDVIGVEYLNNILLLYKNSCKFNILTGTHYFFKNSKTIISRQECIFHNKMDNKQINKSNY